MSRGEVTWACAEIVRLTPQRDCGPSIWEALCCKNNNKDVCPQKGGGAARRTVPLSTATHLVNFYQLGLRKSAVRPAKTHFLCGWANSSNKEVDTTSQTHCQRGWANSSSKKVDTALAADAYVASRLYTVRTLYTRGCTYCTVLYVCAKPPILIVRDCASDKWGWCKRWRNWGYCACCTTRPSTYVLHCVQRA